MDNQNNDINNNIQNNIEQNDTNSNVVEQNNKKNNQGIMLLVCLLIIIIGVLVYFFVIKKPNNEPTPVPTPTVAPTIKPTSTPTVSPTLEPTVTPSNNSTSDDEPKVEAYEYKFPISSTDSEEIKIAKKKLEEASNLIGDLCFEGKSTQQEEEPNYCYYDTVENFKKKFYNIYSSKLVYNDVFLEYNYSTGELSGGTLGYVPEYGIKDNKVYTSRCTVGGNGFVRFDKFQVESKTNDKIVVNYVEVYLKDAYDDNSGEEEMDLVKITLVKENGEWKILNATIVDQCNGTYKVGKE